MVYISQGMSILCIFLFPKRPAKNFEKLHKTNWKNNIFFNLNEIKWTTQEKISAKNQHKFKIIIKRQLTVFVWKVFSCSVFATNMNFLSIFPVFLKLTFFIVAFCSILASISENKFKKHREKKMVFTWWSSLHHPIHKTLPVNVQNCFNSIPMRWSLWFLKMVVRVSQQCFVTKWNKKRCRRDQFVGSYVRGKFKFPFNMLVHVLKHGALLFCCYLQLFLLLLCDQ